MLNETQLEELLDSKESLAEYVTATMLQAMALGLERVRAPNVSPSAIAQFLEVLRKTRADLTGDAAITSMPQMMVNIQFGKHKTSTDLPVIEGQPPSALSGLSNVVREYDRH